MSANFRQQLVDSRLDEFNVSCIGEAPPPYQFSVDKGRHSNNLRAYASRALICLIVASCGLTAASANARSTAYGLSLALGQTISHQLHTTVRFDLPKFAPALPKFALSRKFYENLVLRETSLRWSVRSSAHESVMHGQGSFADVFVVASPRADSSSSVLYLDDTISTKRYKAIVCHGSALQVTLLGSGISAKELGEIFAVGTGESCP